MNELIQGDCKIKLQKIDKNSIDLVYLDPPFFTQKKQVLKNKNNKEFSFDDTWEDINSYKEYIRQRVIECKRVLKNTGSIFLHCDRIAGHHLRVVLDEVFGTKNFQSEIIWFYKRWSNSKKGLLNNHQVIFFYSKTDEFKFNQVYTDYSPTTNLDQIFQERVRNKEGKTTYKTLENGNVELIKEKKGVPLGDVWEIPYLNPKAKERTGYPTQKPILLLERIINLTTSQGDIVLDPFCGSGTTLVSAKLLGRRFIGIDKEKKAIKLAKNRIDNPIKTESNLLKNGKHSYINQEPAILDILNKLGITPVQRNKGIDGFLKIGKLIKPVPVKLQRVNETLEDSIKLLLQACTNNQYSKKIVIKNPTAIKSLFEVNKGEREGLIIIDDINCISNVVKKLQDDSDNLVKIPTSF